jgi:cysteine desulfurase / selenocysteine lyase
MTEPTLTPTPIQTGLRENIVGIGRRVPRMDGTSGPYIYLDNAASTPAFRGVQEKVDGLLEWYSSVHRGTGLKSMVSSQAYDRAHQIVGAFVGADPHQDVVIFGRNTTEAINTLAEIFPFQPGDTVVTTLMEHHSNDLPWRALANVIHIGVDDEGALDMDEMRRCLEERAGQVRLVTVTGASNVTGFMPPIYAIAEMAHAAGALILVDCAQLAPHRAIDMRPHGDPAHLDFVAISGHKLYAPYGSGALIGPREFFAQARPSYRGGGTIEVVTVDEVYWAEPPERYEAGSPNVIGAVALAASLQILSTAGMQVIAEHEQALTAYTLQRMQRIPGLHIYGSADPERLDDRLGVISFALEGIPHGLVAAVLGFEAGIGVRNGCFCAHPYILRILGVQGEEYDTFKEEVLHHDRSHIPGLVRVSFGCYNDQGEVDTFIEWLKRIQAGKTQGVYDQDRVSGTYLPRGYSAASLEPFFSL